MEGKHQAELYQLKVQHEKESSEDKIKIKSLELNAKQMKEYSESTVQSGNKRLSEEIESLQAQLNTAKSEASIVKLQAEDDKAQAQKYKQEIARHMVTQLQCISSNKSLGTTPR